MNTHEIPSRPRSSRRRTALRGPAGLTWLGIMAVAAVVTLSSACQMESSYDVYLEGLKVAGNAEKGPCALVYDSQEQAHVLNSAKIQSCIDEVERAQALYIKARDMGHQGGDVENNIADTEHKLDKLYGMLRMIKRVEVTQQIDAHQ